jgi:hypothetical protein
LSRVVDRQASNRTKKIISIFSVSSLKRPAVTAGRPREPQSFRARSGAPQDVKLEKQRCFRNAQNGALPVKASAFPIRYRSPSGSSSAMLTP